MESNLLSLLKIKQFEEVTIIFDGFYTVLKMLIKS